MYNHDQVPNEKVKLYVKQVVVEGKSSVWGGGVWGQKLHSTRIDFEVSTNCYTGD